MILHECDVLKVREKSAVKKICTDLQQDTYQDFFRLHFLNRSENNFHKTLTTRNSMPTI